MFEYELNPENVKRADIIVGIASYKEAANIAHVTHQVDLGLKKYFKDKKCVIMNCDNDSPDDTKGAFMKTKTTTPKIYITTPPEVAGKGYNFENMFRKGNQLGARATVCIDGDIKSVTPEWVKYFAEPILKGGDYVTPIYSRHKYDGTITNNICYPMIYGLLCMDLRQPIGGDFALSSRFADYLLLQPWHRTTGMYGVDIFLTLNAILGGFKVSQVGLGTKIHKPSAPKLGPMFIQVIGTAFLALVNNVEKWQDLKTVLITEKNGKKKLEKEQSLTLDREALREKVADGFAVSLKDMGKYLRKETFKAVKGRYESGNMDMSEELWVKVVYEMIASFNKVSDHENLLETFRTLYFARTLTFVNDTWGWPTAKAEELIAQQAKTFFDNRSYLIDML